jgi:hypothetical protein
MGLSFSDWTIDVQCSCGEIFHAHALSNAYGPDAYLCERCIIAKRLVESAFEVHRHSWMDKRFLIQLH